MSIIFAKSEDAKLALELVKSLQKRFVEKFLISSNPEAKLIELNNAFENLAKITQDIDNVETSIKSFVVSCFLM